MSSKIEVTKDSVDVLTVRKTHRHGEDLTLTLKREFLEQVGKSLDEVTLYEMFAQFDLAKFLHNDKGPAMIVHRNPHHPEIDGKEFFYLNGQPASDEEINLIVHNAKFTKQLDNIINGDE